MSDERSFDVVVLGGGTGGLTVAARLLNADPALRVAIVEPSETHYYQPLWTLVGAGEMAREVTARAEADYIPAGATWIRSRVVSFAPAEHTVTLSDGVVIRYQQLVVALGIQLDWNKVEGLPAALGKDGVCSNYDYNTVDSTWRTLSTMQGGNAIFTFPSTAMKCGGAPQKIMYLADEHLRRRNVRAKSRVIFASAGARIFGVEKYATALSRIVERKGIETMFRLDLVAVRAPSREAVFRHLDNGSEVVLPYSMLHVVPPQSAPDVIKRSELASAEGWVEVDKHTLQHVRFPDIFALGDNASLPTARTGAAIRKQAPVLVENLLQHRAGAAPSASYNGYSSCPLVTGYGKLMLAEFDYNSNPAETFPFDQSQERYSMYALKRYVLPDLYWNGMLRGRA